MGGIAVTIEEIERNTLLAIGVSILDIVLTAVATWMLIRLIQMQDEKYERFGEGTGVPLTCLACGETIPRRENQDYCPLCGAALINDFMPDAATEDGPVAYR